MQEITDYKGAIMQEIFKDIKGYEGLYKISSLGRVKALTVWSGNGHKSKYKLKETILTPTNNGHGYLIIGLRKNGRRKNFYIHRLVAEAFIDNPDKKPVVNHKDYNIQNNNYNNLEWVTQKENIAHSIKNMRGKKHNSKTNTGERNISYRATKDRYRVIINRKEYGTYKTLKEAIAKRDAILKGVIV